jgi:hypothetical protein
LDSLEDEDYDLVKLDFDVRTLAEYPQNATPTQPQKEYGYRNGELLITATPGLNIALGKPATQIDDHAPTTGAAKAVDGDTNGALWENYASGTNYHLNSWWQVDLQSVQNINSITVWGRTDCCWEMAQNFYEFRCGGSAPRIRRGNGLAAGC